MKNNPFRSKKLKMPKKISKIKIAGEKSASEKNESAERVNRTVYLTVAVLLIVLAVAVAMTSAANKARKEQPEDTTAHENSGITPSTTAPAPEMTLPKPEDTQNQLPPETNAGNDPETPVGSKIPTFALPAEGILGKDHDPTVQVFSNTLGEWRVHLGIDIMTEASAPVYAAAAGKITAVSDDPLWGKCVTVEHEGDAISIYRNLADTLPDGIKVGSKVSEGDLIGAVGDGGVLELADEPHLHFELKVKGADVDPLEYFSKSAIETLKKTVETGIEE